MSKKMEQVGSIFEKVAITLYSHRIKSLSLVMVFTSIFVWHLPNLMIDTSTIGFLSEDHAGRVLYKEFLEQYGRDDAVIVAIESKNIFSADTLNKIKKIHYLLEENVPHLNEVESLINARHTYGENDTLKVDELLSEWPKTDEDFLKVKRLVLSNSNYTNFLVSEDGTFTTLLVKLEKDVQNQSSELLDGFSELEVLPKKEEYVFLSGEEETEAVNAIKTIVNDFKDSETNIYISGSPVVIDSLKSTLMSDMPIFMISALLIITGVLFALFRRISGVFISLSVVVFSMLSTFGLMAWAGVSFTVATQILPSFLIAVAVGASVHLLVIFYRSYDAGKDKLGAVGYAANHSSAPVTMTALTTAIGFLSFIFAEVEPVADLGWVSACGVLFVLIYTITLVPILLSFVSISVQKSKPNVKESARTVSNFDTLLGAIANIPVNHPVKVLSICMIIIATFLYGGTLVGVSYNPLNWFPEDRPVRTNTEHLNEKLRGINTFEVILDTGVENGVYDPQFLKGLEEATKKILPLEEDTVFIGKVHSIADVIKEINQALNNNDPSFYKIPESRELVAQQFFLFENTGSDDLEVIVDSQFRETRMTIKVPWENASKYVALLPKIERVLNDTFSHNIEINVTGMGTLYGDVLRELTISTLKSYTVSLVVISGLMIVFLGGIRVGLLSMIPNVSPILITVGIMGYFGITLNIFTMLIGSIAIGLAVDDTIHFMHNYKRYYFLHGRDSARAVRETLLSSGRAMLVTTLVLTTGFLVFMTSSMSNLFEFGLLTGISILLALLADFFLAPAIVILLSKYIYGPEKILGNEIQCTSVVKIERRKNMSSSNFVGIERRKNAFTSN